MKLELNQDVLVWLDSVRGDTSRQKYIVKVLRNYMNETDSKKGNNAKEYHTNGAIDALSQVG